MSDSPTITVPGIRGRLQGARAGGTTVPDVRTNGTVPDVRLQIDWTRCDGHGLCARILPEAITLDEWGFPVIGSPAEASADAIRLAIQSCPRLALRV